MPALALILLSVGYFSLYTAFNGDGVGDGSGGKTYSLVNTVKAALRGELKRPDTPAKSGAPAAKSKAVSNGRR